MELIKVNVLNCVKEFNLRPSPKQRSPPEESQGSSGGVIANTLKKVRLILQLQKWKEMCSVNWKGCSPSPLWPCLFLAGFFTNQTNV